MDNPHFEAPPTWEAAREWLTFEPLRPSETLGYSLQGLRVFVRDHKMRDVAVGERSFEAHYGAFVISQTHRSAEEAARLALEVRYGLASVPALILGRPARVYELGPEPPPDDVDGRSPAVVAWHDSGLFLLVASAELPTADLLRIAMSMHPPA